MSYKISITIDVGTRKQRDQFLRGLRDLLLLARGAKGKVKVARTVDVHGGEELDLQTLGLDEPAIETPLERAINGVTPAP